MARRSRRQPARAGRRHHDRRLLAIATDFRARDADTPLVLMGYANPILAGARAVRRRCRKAGVDGVICVDLPPEEDRTNLAPRCAPLACIAGPAGDADHRCGAAACRARRRVGFLYYVSVAGITGAAGGTGRIEAAVARLKAATTFRLPSASACARPSRPLPSPNGRCAWWWAPRSSI
jgi:tryptophan synthase alpha chain